MGPKFLFAKRISRSCFSRFLANEAQSKKFDVVVVGGGHAGCESAAASSRCGARTLLITHRISTIGEMSCNPSFGGIGKGHLMREVDALDGLCATVSDLSAISYRALNRRAGPAVLGIRAQIDRKQYKKVMQEKILRDFPNLTVIEGSVGDLKLETSVLGNRTEISGCHLLDGTVIATRCIIITTGTFLNGQIFRGAERLEGGRIGENATYGLSESFKRIGFKLGRLRTGTPARLIAETIDFSCFEKIDPDPKPIPFSFITGDFWIPPEKQIPTHLGHTNQKTNELVLASIDDTHISVTGTDIKGPRYCPSIETKVVRFGNLNHRFFLEPEGIDDPIIYPQGLSMSMEPDKQLKIMRSISGMEKVQLHRPGYVVTYDFVDPRQLQRSLETKPVAGLFLAGQINGTTGYEEAAAQGIIAGINAALKSKSVSNKYEPFIIERNQGYIGVMIDDLTSMGLTEPYRMFPSRVEFRLNLRPENADLRLTPLGWNTGVISQDRYKKFMLKKSRLEDCRNKLKYIEQSIESWSTILPDLHPSKNKRVSNALDLLTRFPGVRLDDLIKKYPSLLGEFKGDSDLEELIRNEGRYSIFFDYFNEMNERLKLEMETKLPEDIDYYALKEINLECREKLSNYRPKNLAAASRIPGITQVALIDLLRHSKKK